MKKMGKTHLIRIFCNIQNSISALAQIMFQRFRIKRIYAENDLCHSVFDAVYADMRDIALMFYKYF